MKVGVEWMRMGAQDNTTNNSGGTFNFVANSTGIPGQSVTWKQLGAAAAARSWGGTTNIYPASS